jgi:tRNA (pseudouridine54-N1)-methyltransferase
MAVEGSTLHDVRTDMQTWAQILKEVLSGKNHPGISLEKLSFEAFLRLRAELGRSRIYVLEEGGEDVSKVEFGGNPIFVLGDHVGLPRRVEDFALRFGRKISLGKKPYLAATCITILNYILDRRESWKIER